MNEFINSIKLNLCNKIGEIRNVERIYTIHIEEKDNEIENLKTERDNINSSLKNLILYYQIKTKN